jgi:glycosyltransferase involved in cell wall biosynthesis
MSTARRYRVLQIFNRYLEPGGEEASVELISALLSPRVDLAACFFESRAWTGPSAPPRWKQALFMIHNPSSLTKVRQQHRASDPDVWLVHNVFPVGSAAIYREALKLRVPIVYYIHNFRPFSVNGYLWAGEGLAREGLRKRFWKEIRHGAWQNSVIRTAWYASVLKLMHELGWFRAVKAWIAVSEFMRQKFIEAGVPAEDVFTVRHACRPMDAPRSPRDGGYYLFLGRLTPAKGIRVLLDAWAIVRRERGDRAPRLVICGAGPSERWVREQAAANPLVEFRGTVRGAVKDDLLAGCRAMIAPSIWWEPLGLVTYEAYDHAKPMLAARSGGLAETVIDGRTGMLHEPSDAAELARHVIELDASPDRRVEMGRSGREWLLANTSEEDWRRKIEKVIEHALRS